MKEVPQLHIIEEDLSENWVEDYAAQGIKEVQVFLDKHQAFFAYIYEQDAQAALAESEAIQQH